jgi:hypothetical protein
MPPNGSQKAQNQIQIRNAFHPIGKSCAGDIERASSSSDHANPAILKITSAGAGPFLHAYHATKRQSKSSKSIGQEGRILPFIRSARVVRGTLKERAAAATTLILPF